MTVPDIVCFIDSQNTLYIFHSSKIDITKIIKELHTNGINYKISALDKHYEHSENIIDDVYRMYKSLTNNIE